MNGLFGSGSGVVGTSSQTPLRRYTTTNFALLAETVYGTPRLTAPDRGLTDAPSRGLVACICQTGVSRNVAPPVGAGTVAGSTASSRILVFCGSGAAETTRMRALP